LALHFLAFAFSRMHNNPNVALGWCSATLHITLLAIIAAVPRTVDPARWLAETLLVSSAIEQALATCLHYTAGGVSIVSEAAATASVSSSGRSTPSPSDNGSADQGRDYFSQEPFNGFVPDPDDNLIAKLSKLSIHQGWSKNEAKRRRAELVEFEVLRHYGPDKSSLEKWQELCRDVTIDPAPPSITQCKKAS
jgi:hypothetical protein